MKQVTITALALFMVVSCRTPNDEAPTQPSNQKEEIMQKEEKRKIAALLDQYKTSLNTSDASLAQSLYTKEGIFMPTEAPSANGSEAIFKSYQFIFSQIQLNIEFYIDEIEVENNLAFATTRSEGTTLIHATDDTIPEANRELFVLKK